LAVNTVTNRAYTVDQFDFKLEVLDAGDISLLATVTLDFGLRKIAVNPTTNRIHVTQPAGASLWIIDGSTNTYTNRLWLGLYEPLPISLAVNPQTSYVYVANGGGNPNFGGQSISVIDDPPEPIVQLQSLVERVRNYNLTNGTSNSLDSKLQNALDALGSMNNGNISNVCNKLNSFINEVESHQELTTEQATNLINAGTRVRRTLGCG